MESFEITNLKHKSCCYGNQYKEKENQADQDAYVDQLRDDTGLEKHHLKERMQNREEWRGLVKYVRASCSA